MLRKLYLKTNKLVNSIKNNWYDIVYLFYLCNIDF